MKKQEKIDFLKYLLKFVRSKDFGKGKHYDGLCIIAENREIKYQIYLIKILPARLSDGAYCWKYGAKAPRIRFLKEQIKKLEGKK
ncbi:hypothetical protein [Immundisolibacter sp.]